MQYSTKTYRLLRKRLISAVNTNIRTSICICGSRVSSRTKIKSAIGDLNLKFVCVTAAWHWFYTTTTAAITINTCEALQVAHRKQHPTGPARIRSFFAPHAAAISCSERGTKEYLRRLAKPTTEIQTRKPTTDVDTKNISQQLYITRVTPGCREFWQRKIVNSPLASAVLSGVGRIADK
jgi:hypothetical protein